MLVMTPTSGQRPPPKVELDEIDQQWLPEDGNTLTVTMRVNGGKDAQAIVEDTLAQSYWDRFRDANGSTRPYQSTWPCASTSPGTALPASLHSASKGTQSVWPTSARPPGCSGPGPPATF